MLQPIHKIVEATYADSYALEAYANYLQDFDHNNFVNRLRIARRFVRANPDLAQWQSLPLIDRIGSKYPRHGEKYICVAARPYLYFLVQQGLIELDWFWIIGVQTHVLPVFMLPRTIQEHSNELVKIMQALDYKESSLGRIERAVKYFFIRYGNTMVNIGELELDEFRIALEIYQEREDVLTIHGSKDELKRYTGVLKEMLFTYKTALYQNHRISQPAKRIAPGKTKLLVKPRIKDYLEKYVQARLAFHARTSTVGKFVNAGRHLADWLNKNYPSLESFAELTREQVLAYSADLVSSGINPETLLTRLSSLSVMFHDTTAWEWTDAPARPLIGSRDLPKRPNRIPRFIPAEELDRIMNAIRTLECPYQRTALIVARWSGARRGEISRLELDCLDFYLDGTPRLRIPVGKTGSERLIPLHPEAAEAIKALQIIIPPSRGFKDEYSSKETPRLFVRHGLCLTSDYLFEQSLQIACTQSGLINDEGKGTITAHRFRHTVGTELVEGGARLHTIMKMLGHTSTGMTLVYAHLSDATLREEYMRVLGPGAQIAGQLAATLRAGAMPPDSIAWLKANFFRTELELGHCLRLPEEGPCECDLYLNCAKFVTTPEYIPRLRERIIKEISLAAEARERGFDREVERHECIRKRIEQLLIELGEETYEK
ncbi:MAG: integrase [Methylomonas sp.]|nr:MAG: integrase [Methylomonas sp.]